MPAGTKGIVNLALVTVRIRAIAVPEHPAFRGLAFRLSRGGSELHLSRGI
jgi:hypothetical protein